LKSVGIDVGNYSIKVAEADSSGKNAGTITNFFERPLNTDPRADRELEVIEGLRAIVSQYDIGNTRFVVGIPQNEVSVRHRHFPFKDRLKILKSLAFELEDEIPLDVDDATFEAKITEYLGDTAEVMVVACPNDSVQAAISRLKDGGIDPEILTVEGLALANIFEKWQLPPAQMPAPPDISADGEDEQPKLPQLDGRIVLDIGFGRTLLLAYRENALVAARSISWGGREVVDSLAKTFNIPFLEAVKVLDKKSFILMNSQGASRDQMILSTTVSKQVDQLVREVRLTILDLRSEFNINFTAVDLLGGVSQIQNLGPYLTQNLEIPANHYHHFPNHRGVRIEQSQAVEATSALAIGLAIEGCKKPRNPATNLRKGEYARQNKSLQLFWEKYRPAVITAAVGFCLFFVFAVIRDSMADRLVVASADKVRDQAAATELPKNERSPTGVEKYIRETRKQIETRQTLSKLDNYSHAMDVLRDIASNMPLGSEVGGVKMAMGIQTLTIDNDNVFIQGKVSNSAQVATVQSALAKVANGKVEKAQVSNALPGGVPFAFSFKVNRMVAQ
jgi:general secretion pathway protein L